MCISSNEIIVFHMNYVDVTHTHQQLPEEGQQRFQELSDTMKLLNTRLETAERNLRQTQEEKEKAVAQRSRLEGDITLLKVVEERKSLTCWL